MNYEERIRKNEREKGKDEETVDGTWRAVCRAE